MVKVEDVEDEELMFVANIVEATALADKDDEAVVTDVAKHTAGDLAKSVKKSMKDKLGYAGGSEVTYSKSKEYYRALETTLSDSHQHYKPVMSLKVVANAKYCRCANEKLYVVLWHTCRDEARDLVLMLLEAWFYFAAQDTALQTGWSFGSDCFMTCSTATSTRAIACFAGVFVVCVFAGRGVHIFIHAHLL